MHKSQVLFYLLLAFLSGVFVASFLLVSQTWILVFLISAISLIAISGYQKTYSKRGLLAGVLSLIFIFGIIRFNSFNLANSILNQFADMEAGGKGVAVTLNGYIDDEPSVSGDKMSFAFRAKELVMPGKTIKVDERTLVTVNSFPLRNYGDELSLNGALKTPENFTDFDYITYLKKDGIRTLMSFPKITSMGSLDMGFWERNKVGLYKNIFIVKNKFRLSLNRSVSEPGASFLAGILLGARQDIHEDLKNAFNRTGTTHILAISGYNITIISEVILAIFVLFMKRKKAFWFSVLIVVLFTVMTGASASVVRASLMGLLLLFANGYGRLYDAKNSVVLAGAVMIFVNPFVLSFDVGFQLSFLAVLGLLFLYPHLNRKTIKVPELGGVKDLALMTISAQVFVLPLLIYYFHQFSLLSLPTNILVLPFVPFAMLTGFMSGVSGMIFLPLGKMIGLVAWAVTTYQIKIIEFFAGF